MKGSVKKFRDFEKIYEQAEVALKGYPADVIIKRISELMEIFPDRVRFGIPADTKGHSISYRDANGAIEKIKDVQHYYEGKGEEVRFYCWSINYSGSWDATQSLRAKIDKFGGFGREQNMNLKKVMKYFEENSEDVDNVRSLSISIDSKSIRKDIKKEDTQEASESPTEPTREDESEELI